MGNTVGKAAALDFGIQWACWAVASILQTEKFYDFAGLLNSYSAHAPIAVTVGGGTVIV